PFGPTRSRAASDREGPSSLDTESNRCRRPLCRPLRCAFRAPTPTTTEGGRRRNEWAPPVFHPATPRRTSVSGRRARSHCRVDRRRTIVRENRIAGHRLLPVGGRAPAPPAPP